MPRQQPKYQKLQEDLVDRIRTGEWKPGERIPSELQLAEEYGLAYMTVRSAVRQLVESGHIRRIRGRGTFVVDRDIPGRRPALGLLLPPQWHSVDPFYFPPIVAGFMSQADELGYRVHLADRTEPHLEFLTFQELHIEGAACVLGDQGDLLDADALLDRGIVVVAINEYGGSRRIPSVSPNNRDGAYQATRWLLQQGHRDVAFLAGPRWNLDATERRRGVQRAVRDAGLDDRSLTILEGDFTEATGYERGHRLWRARRRPTAVVCGSDLVAMGVLQSCYESGIRVPDEVSVLGFGDFRLAAYACPALTTVRMPLEDLGRRAAIALEAQLRGVYEPAALLSCDLVVRDSVLIRDLVAAR